MQFRHTTVADIIVVNNMIPIDRNQNVFVSFINCYH